MKRIWMVMLALAACGDDSGATQFPDANNPEDSSVPDPDTAPVAAVTVSVTTAGEPIEGAAVYFQTADGTLLARAMTDVNGHAAQVMDAGGRVTVASPFGTDKRSPELFTFIGVKPGDTLRVPDRLNDGGREVAFSAPVSSINNTTYRFFSSSGRADSPTSTQMPQGTALTYNNATTVDAVMVNHNGATAIPQQWIAATNVAITGAEPVVEFPGAWAPMTDETWTVTNVPTGINAVNLVHHQATARGVVFSGNLGLVELENGGGVVTESRPPVGTTSVLEVIYGTRGGSFVTQRSAVVWKPFAEAQTYDLAQTGLTPINSFVMAVNQNAALDWTEGTPGVAADALYAHLSIARASASSFRWFILAPHGDSQLVLPALPEDLSAFRPGALDSISIEDLKTFKVPGGYDAVRGAYFAAELEGGFELLGAVLGAPSGQALLQVYDPPPPS